MKDRWLITRFGGTGLAPVMFAILFACGLVLPAFCGGRHPPQVNLSTHHDRVDIQLDDEVQVRTLNLPPVYDDKGNPRQYTWAERQKLKGKSRELGYLSEYDNLKKGQIVNVSLGQKASDSKKPGGPGNKSIVTVGKTKWIPMGELMGAIVKLDGTTKQLTLSVESVTLPHTPRPDSALIQAALADRVGYKILILSMDPGQIK
jgi:hypothetical protein